MKLSNGKAYVPPACPRRKGNIDVENAQFILIVGPTSQQGMTQIFAFFDITIGKVTTGIVTTEPIVVPSDDELVSIANRIFKTSALRERLRLELLENVRRCKRPCVALSKKGLEQALRRVG